jgi:hypothetical protein
MPKQRPPFDVERYRDLQAQGHSNRKIAELMGMPESTLRDNLKILQAQHNQGIPMETQGIPIPESHTEPIESAEVTSGGHQVDLEHYLPGLVDELKAMLGWWRQRQQSAQQPTEKLERVTYHVAPKWIEAVRREADLTGESYAGVVNRAFAQYFTREGSAAEQRQPRET